MQPFEVVVVAVFVLVIPAFATLGFVLLLRFWAVRFNRAVRTIAAIIPGPLVSLSFVAVAALAQEMNIPVLAAVLALLLVMPMLLIGFPVSYFATRKLDRMVEGSISIFE